LKEEKKKDDSFILFTSFNFLNFEFDIKELQKETKDV